MMCGGSERNLVVAVHCSEGVSFLEMAEAVFYGGGVGVLVEAFARIPIRELKNT